MCKPEPDPLLDEIRAIRARISWEHGDDVRRSGEYYMELSFVPVYGLVLAAVITAAAHGTVDLRPIIRFPDARKSAA